MKSDKNKSLNMCCFVDFKQAFASVWERTTMAIIK